MRAEERSKIDPTSREVFLLGYEGNNYRLWDAAKGAVRVSSSFEETEQTTFMEVYVEEIQRDEGELEEVEPESSTATTEPEVQSPVQPDMPGARRSDRKTRKPNWFTVNQSEALQAEGDDPITYTAAVNRVDGTESKAAVNRELEVRRRTGTWRFAEVPEERRPLLRNGSAQRREAQQGPPQRERLAQ